MRLVATGLPALLFAVALFLIFLPDVKADPSSVFIVVGVVGLLNAPSISLVVLLRYPLGEVRYMLTKEALEKLKAKGVQKEILDGLQTMQRQRFLNRPEFLEALQKTIGEKELDPELRRLVLKQANEEEAIED